VMAPPSILQRPQQPAQQQQQQLKLR
jgi:hypothetical protein